MSRFNNFKNYKRRKRMNMDCIWCKWNNHKNPLTHYACTMAAVRHINRSTVFQITSNKSICHNNMTCRAQDPGVSYYFIHVYTTINGTAFSRHGFEIGAIFCVHSNWVWATEAPKNYDWTHSIPSTSPYPISQNITIV